MCAIVDDGAVALKSQGRPPRATAAVRSRAVNRASPSAASVCNRGAPYGTRQRLACEAGHRRRARRRMRSWHPEWRQVRHIARHGRPAAVQRNVGSPTRGRRGHMPDRARHTRRFIVRVVTLGAPGFLEMGTHARAGTPMIQRSGHYAKQLRQGCDCQYQSRRAPEQSGFQRK